MEELDLKSLIQMLLNRWWILVVSVLVFTLTAGIISFFILDPIYQANTTLYIVKKVEKEGDLAYNDLLISTQLVKDYRELAKSKLVANKVISELGLTNITAEQLSNKLNVSLKNETRVIQITVEDKDPVLASTLANKAAEVFREKVVEIMQVENVQVIDVAEIPAKPVKPNKQMNMAIAFVIGLMIGAGIIFMIEYFDNTIKTSEDVKKYTDLPVLGTIPVFPE